MSSEEQTSAFEEDKDVTIGPSHPGLDVFLPNNALRYFTAESICREELGGEKRLDFWLENEMYYHAAKKMFQKRYSPQQSEGDDDIDEKMMLNSEKCFLPKSWTTFPPVKLVEPSDGFLSEHFKKLRQDLADVDDYYSNLERMHRQQHHQSKGDSNQDNCCAIIEQIHSSLTKDYSTFSFERLDVSSYKCKPYTRFSEEIKKMCHACQGLPPGEASHSDSSVPVPQTSQGQDTRPEQQNKVDEDTPPFIKNLREEISLTEAALKKLDEVYPGPHQSKGNFKYDNATTKKHLDLLYGSSAHRRPIKSLDDRREFIKYLREEMSLIEDALSRFDEVYPAPQQSQGNIYLHEECELRKRMNDGLPVLKAAILNFDEGYPEPQQSGSCCKGNSHSDNKTTSKEMECLLSKDNVTSDHGRSVESPDKENEHIKKLRHHLSQLHNDSNSFLFESPAQKSPDKESGGSMEGIQQDSDEHKGVNQHPPQDMSALFYLMSVVPHPYAFTVKRFLDEDDFAWKISLYDLILVFLNWGATLDSLDIDEGLRASFSDLFPPQLPPRTSEETTSAYSSDHKKLFPPCSGLLTVMVAVTERLPEISKSARAMLMKMLVYGALDNRNRQQASVYNRALKFVLDSYPSWDKDEAAAVVRQLRLDRMGLQNAEYVCSSVFLSCGDTREGLLGLVACHNVLRHQFNLPAKISLSAVVDKLTMPPALLNKFSLVQIFVLTELLHSILKRHTLIPPFSHSKNTIYKLHNWSQEVRNYLNKPQYTVSLENAYVRERLSRLSFECSSVMRLFFFSGITQSFSFNNSQENSPCK